MFLTIFGSILFGLGFVKKAQDMDPYHGFLLWGAGCALLIPGLYYCVMICKAYRAKDENERQDLLNEIPEL